MALGFKNDVLIATIGNVYPPPFRLSYHYSQEHIIEKLGQPDILEKMDKGRRDIWHTESIMSTLFSRKIGSFGGVYKIRST